MAFEPNIGEKILWKANPSWKGMLVFYVKYFLILLVVFVVLNLMRSHEVLIGTKLLVAATFGGAALILVIGYIMLISTTYIITNQRVIHYSGIIVRKRDECTILRIQNTMVTITIVERLFGIGKINIDTAADDNGNDMLFWGVNDPYKVASHISSQKHQYENDHVLEV